LGIKGSILRILTNNPHKGMTDKFLLNIYATWPINIETSLKWEIGNALAETASKDSVKDIIDLIKDKRHGTDREMLAIALGNIGDKTAIPFLISCLDDEDITGHVVIALGKLKAIEALDEIKRLSNHEKSWIRQEVKRAIRKIEKEIDKQSS
jgi:HEAT repeat protein